MTNGATRSLWAASAASAVLVFTSCTNAKTLSGSEPAQSVVETTVAPETTVPPSTSTTTSTSTTSTSTTSTSTTSTSTTTTTTTTTLPHGPALQPSFLDGSPIPAVFVVTVRQVHDAALHRDYAALRALGGPKFRSGIIGDEDPIGKWEIAFAKGEPDPLPRLIRLLETTPGIGPDGSIVYPYIALKDAATWDAADEGLLLTLGFVRADIDAARLKGRYLDERVVFDSTGAWKAFAIGA